MREVALWVNPKQISNKIISSLGLEMAHLLAEADSMKEKIVRFELKREGANILIMALGKNWTLSLVKPILD